MTAATSLLLRVSTTGRQKDLGPKPASEWTGWDDVRRSAGIAAAPQAGPLRRAAAGSGPARLADVAARSARPVEALAPVLRAQIAALGVVAALVAALEAPAAAWLARHDGEWFFAGTAAALLTWPHAAVGPLLAGAAALGLAAVAVSTGGLARVGSREGYACAALCGLACLTALPVAVVLVVYVVALALFLAFCAAVAAFVLFFLFSVLSS